MRSAKEIIEYLKQISSEKYKNNVIKLGIPEECSIGVSTGEIRKLAKKIGVSHDLAKDLWHTEYHEARLLAILIMDTKSVDFRFLDGLMKDIISWDLCDHICKNLIIKLPDYDDLIQSPFNEHTPTLLLPAAHPTTRSPARGCLGLVVRAWCGRGSPVPVDQMLES